MFTGKLNGFLTIAFQIVQIICLFIIANNRSFFGFFHSHMVFFERFVQHFYKMFFIVRPQIIAHVPHILQYIHISVQYFRIICHYRTIVMVAADMFVKIIWHTWVENFIHTLLLNQMHNTAMHHFCRVAYCIRWNSCLSFQK